MDIFLNIVAFFTAIILAGLIKSSNKSKTLKQTWHATIFLHFILFFIVVFGPSSGINSLERESYFYLVLLVFILLNTAFTFVLEVKELITEQLAIKEKLHKLLSIAFTSLSNIIIFAYFYYIYGVEGKSGPIVGDMVTSLYFSIVTWTTLGYGDLSPTNDLRLLASLEALMGYVYMAFLIGIILNVISVNKSK